LGVVVSLLWHWRAVHLLHVAGGLVWRLAHVHGGILLAVLRCHWLVGEREAGGLLMLSGRLRLNWVLIGGYSRLLGFVLKLLGN
jgi:hypothetical protein